MISAAAPGIKVPPVTSRMPAGARLNASNARSREIWFCWTRVKVRARSVSKPDAPGWAGPNGPKLLE